MQMCRSIPVIHANYGSSASVENSSLKMIDLFSNSFVIKMNVIPLNHPHASPTLINIFRSR